MSIEEAGDETPIIVEFQHAPGVRQVSRLSAEEVTKRSAEALDHAMGTVKGMSRRFQTTISSLAVQPSTTELEFGIKLDAAAGAVLAKAGAEASMNVKLTWSRDAGRAA